MRDKKIYLTKDGLAELKKEHEELTRVKRPEVLARVSQARNMGDLAENAEYVAAREELSFVDGRIEEIGELLKQASVIHEKNVKGTIKLGSRVILNTGAKKEEFMVVGEWEADPREKKISHQSPLGKALLGKKIGEEVEVEAPAGRIKYAIIDVK